MGLYRALRPLAFALSPETAHSVGKATLRLGAGTGTGRRLLERHFTHEDPRLAVECFGTTFQNPVGVAAGFDKNATVPHGLGALGFGFVEVGTVTPYPQPGNERPRLFRLPEERALVNRMGLNGAGMERVADRLATLDTAVPIGVNIGPMNEAGDSAALEHYRLVYERLAPLATYVVVNVSCPNTPGDAAEDDPAYLRRLFETLTTAEPSPPLLVKIGPDTTEDGILELLEIVHEADVAGIIATNTTTERPGVSGAVAAETGGLSGPPLAEKATETVRTVATNTDLPIIGVGGIDSPERAYERIRAGATLLQLYTALIYEGPGVAREINRGLASLLREDGFDSVEAAVGADLA